MDTYNSVIDSDMIRNILQTNINESFDLFSLKLLLYIVVLGLIPSYLIYKVDIEYRDLKYELLAKLKSIGLSIVVIVIILFGFSKYYASFFREHKSLRYSVNPGYWIYSIGKYVSSSLNTVPKELKKIALDAKVVEYEEDEKEDDNHTELIVLVVGESARADHFSLNGYSKDTNPLLKQDSVISLSNIYSCGTSTAYSVPCMFSIFDRADYSYNKAKSTQNLLDVLSRAGIKILWRDNNSDSKGVALRVDYEDFKSPKNNPVCDIECRDEGMLSNLDRFIKANPNKDILIVLHQMGSHGPAYYKRYPKKFEKFKPVCKTNQLQECTQEEILNAYDNTILYTDYFLDKVIKFLKKYDGTYETAMIYMSDHGESLGENGIYLHGLPYFMAPQAQKHIASIMWFGKGIKEDVNITKVAAKKDNHFTQDDLFHTILGIFEVNTTVYQKDMDILNVH